MSVVAAILHAILCSAAVGYASLWFIHVMQLEGYQPRNYLRWLKQHFLGACASFPLIGILAIALELIRVFFARTDQPTAFFFYYAAEWLYLLLIVYFGSHNNRRKRKKPLVYTSRVKRLILLLALVAAAFYFELFLGLRPSAWGSFLLSRFLHYLPGMSLPLFLLLPFMLLLPLEWLIKRVYYKSAQRKLAAREDMIKIGVTGSFGKTSMKFMLGALLEKNYHPVVPPSSFNTPMGLTRVIREQMTREHDLFVAEMGARNVGDIRELCELIRPGIGVLTSVGKQHLETFGSLERVAAAKYELIESLPPDGAAFFNGDNALCRELYEKCPLKAKFLYGFDPSFDWVARELRVGVNGSSFELVPRGEPGIACQTALLGRHNIQNIAGAAAAAHYLGVSREAIRDAIAGMEPVEHRLALIRGPVTVIDDAFNANPEGARAALEVLASFPGRKIIVTPGMVELGEEEEAQNKAFGEAIAGVADIALLVGLKRSRPIYEGMREKGFGEAQILVVRTLDEASERLAKMTREGDVVLFENDLPDNYNE